MSVSYVSIYYNTTYGNCKPINTVNKGDCYMNPINWLKSRIDERTSWDGAILILVGVIILIAGPFAKIAAYGAIGYGAWTLWKKEK